MLLLYAATLLQTFTISARSLLWFSSPHVYLYICCRGFCRVYIVLDPVQMFDMFCFVLVCLSLRFTLHSSSHTPTPCHCPQLSSLS